MTSKAGVSTRHTALSRVKDQDGPSTGAAAGFFRAQPAAPLRPRQDCAANLGAPSQRGPGPPPPLPHLVTWGRQGQGRLAPGSTPGKDVRRQGQPCDVRGGRHFLCSFQVDAPPHRPPPRPKISPILGGAHRSNQDTKVMVAIQGGGVVIFFARSPGNRLRKGPLDPWSSRLVCYFPDQPLALPPPRRMNVWHCMNGGVRRLRQEIRPTSKLQ